MTAVTEKMLHKFYTFFVQQGHMKLFAVTNVPQCRNKDGDVCRQRADHRTSSTETTIHDF